MAKQPSPNTHTSNIRNYFVLIGARARLEQIRQELAAILRECPELSREDLAPALAQHVSSLLAPATAPPASSNGASRVTKPLKKPLSAAKRAAIATAQEARWSTRRKPKTSAAAKHAVKLERQRLWRLKQTAKGLTTRGTPQKKKNVGTPAGSWTPQRREKFINTMRKKGIFKRRQELQTSANDLDTSTPHAAPMQDDLTSLAWQNDGSGYMTERPVSYAPEPPADVI